VTSRVECQLALVVCAAVTVAGTLVSLARSRPAQARGLAPDWVSLLATALVAAAAVRLDVHPRWLRVRRVLLWTSLLLMMWRANGLPLDVLRLTPLIPLPVDWPGLATRTLALAAALMLARVVLARPGAAVTGGASWYGHVAFALALPYPVLRTWWALGGTVGLTRPGAAGPRAAWLACIPWLLAAVLSLLLVRAWRGTPRRLLLTAGWSATAIVGLVGPGACWALIARLLSGHGGSGAPGMALWVPALFYGSWLLWPLAAGAATRSYQLRTASPLPPRPPLPSRA
jgi:hypothetical protein